MPPLESTPLGAFRQPGLIMGTGIYKVTNPEKAVRSRSFVTLGSGVGVKSPLGPSYQPWKKTQPGRGAAIQSDRRVRVNRKNRAGAAERSLPSIYTGCVL